MWDVYIIQTTVVCAVCSILYVCLLFCSWVELAVEWWKEFEQILLIQGVCKPSMAKAAGDVNGHLRLWLVAIIAIMTQTIKVMLLLICGKNNNQERII